MRKIPGLLHAVQYERTGKHSGPFQHVAEGPTELIGLRDGSVKLRSTDGRRLWGEDADGEAWLENPPRRKGRKAMAYRSKHTGRFVKGHRRHNEPGRRRRRRHNMAAYTANPRRHRRSRRRHHNPYLAAFNPRGRRRHHRLRSYARHYRMALTHYFSQKGIMEAATVGASGLAGATGTFLGERVLFSYATFLTPYASGADWTSILVRAVSRLGLAALLPWALGGFFRGSNRTGFIAGTLTYATGATLLEAVGYQLPIGQGVPVSDILNRVGITTVAGYIPRPMGSGFPRTNGIAAYVPHPGMPAIYPGGVAAYVPRPAIGDLSIMDRAGLGEMYSHPFRAYGY